VNFRAFRGKNIFAVLRYTFNLSGPIQVERQQHYTLILLVTAINNFIESEDFMSTINPDYELPPSDTVEVACETLDVSGAIRSPTITIINQQIQTKANSSHTHPVSQITGLGTAATCNTGTASGNIPILDASGKLNVSVIPSMSGGGAVDSVNGKMGAVVLVATDVGAIPNTEKGVAGGVAILDASGKIPSTFLPAPVDAYTKTESDNRFVSLTTDQKVGGQKIFTHTSGVQIGDAGIGTNPRTNIKGAVIQSYVPNCTLTLASGGSATIMAQRESDSEYQQLQIHAASVSGVGTTLQYPKSGKIVLSNVVGSGKKLINDIGEFVNLPPDDGKAYSIKRNPGSTQLEYVEVSGTFSGDGFPVGTVMLQPFTEEKHLHNGDEWWACNGAVFDLIDYPGLQNVLGITPLEEFGNLLPSMTSDTAPAGNMASASHVDQSSASYAFDGNIFTSWQTPPINAFLSPPVTLTRKVPSPLGKIGVYGIIARADGSRVYPTTWVLEVSEDGTNWTVIDEQTNVTLEEDNSLFLKLLKLPTPYEGNGTYFRWTFTRCSGDGQLSIDEILFFENIATFALPEIADDEYGYSTYMKMKSGFASDNLQIGDRVTLARNDSIFTDEWERIWLLADGSVYDVDEYPELIGKKGIVNAGGNTFQLPSISSDANGNNVYVLAKK